MNYKYINNIYIYVLFPGNNEYIYIFESLRFFGPFLFSINCYLINFIPIRIERAHMTVKIQQ